MLMNLFKTNHHYSLSTPRRFYLLSRAPFYQMEKYTFISLYYLRILPAHQIFCLNQYFPVLGNKCSIKTFGILNCSSVFFLSKQGEIASHLIFNDNHSSAGVVKMMSSGHQSAFLFIVTILSIVKSTVSLHASCIQQL